MCIFKDEERFEMAIIENIRLTFVLVDSLKYLLTYKVPMGTPILSFVTPVHVRHLGSLSLTPVIFSLNAALAALKSLDKTLILSRSICHTIYFERILQENKSIEIMIAIIIIITIIDSYYSFPIRNAPARNNILPLRAYSRNHNSTPWTCLRAAQTPT